MIKLIIKATVYNWLCQNCTKTLALMTINTTFQTLKLRRAGQYSLTCTTLLYKQRKALVFVFFLHFFP